MKKLKTKNLKMNNKKEGKRRTEDKKKCIIFFVNQEQISGKEIKILGQDVRHIRQVLRMEEGEQLLIGDGEGKEYLCQIQNVEEKVVTAMILEQRDSQTELPSEITLYQGLPKGDKMELIVQKTVELGVSRIVPVEMKRCVVKLDQKKAGKKERTLGTDCGKCSKAEQTRTDPRSV